MAKFDSRTLVERFVGEPRSKLECFVSDVIVPAAFVLALVGAVELAGVPTPLRRLFSSSTVHSSSEDQPGRKHAVFLDPDMPVDATGKTYHLQTGPGDVANRVLSVGDVGRAKRISSLMSAVRSFTSSRGFVTHTGEYKGQRISIVATGMGFPMADFVVRECRAVVEGPMAFLRFGTCGGLGNVRPGTVVVATEGSVLVRREPDAVGQALAQGASSSSQEVFPYSVSKPVPAHAALSSLYMRCMRESVEGSGLAASGVTVQGGMDATADSFYSSQGRKGKAFLDWNESLIAQLCSRHPTLCTLQMETFHFFDLARAASPAAPVHAAAAAIVLVNRNSAATVSKEDLHTLEMAGGRAALNALAAFAL